MHAEARSLWLKLNLAETGVSIFAVEPQKIQYSASEIILPLSTVKPDMFQIDKNAAAS